MLYHPCFCTGLNLKQTTSGCYKISVISYNKFSRPFPNAERGVNSFHLDVPRTMTMCHILGPSRICVSVFWHLTTLSPYDRRHHTGRSVASSSGSSVRLSRFLIELCIKPSVRHGRIFMRYRSSTGRQFSLPPHHGRS